MTKEEVLDLVFKMLQENTRTSYDEMIQTTFVTRVKDKIVLVRDNATPPVIISLDIDIKEIEI